MSNLGLTRGYVERDAFNLGKSRGYEEGLAAGIAQGRREALQEAAKALRAEAEADALRLKSERLLDEATRAVRRAEAAEQAASRATSQMVSLTRVVAERDKAMDEVDRRDVELTEIDRLARAHITRTPLVESTTGRVAVLCEELLSTVEESQRQRRRAEILTVERDQARAQRDGMRGERDAERQIAVGWQRKHEDLEASVAGSKESTCGAVSPILRAAYRAATFERWAGET